MGTISVFEIFSIGIGPSSSHTVGPMRASRRFLFELFEREFLEDVDHLTVELYGSLALTGRGHATDIAILMGLEGELPESIDPNNISSRVALIEKNKSLCLFGKHPILFNPESDLQFLFDKRLPFHSNAIRFKAFDQEGFLLHMQLYYSVGGGFIVDQNEAMHGVASKTRIEVPFPYKTAEQLINHALKKRKAIWEIVYENEKVQRSPEEIRLGILKIWQVMKDSVKRGLSMTGVLPGGLGVKRRAAEIYQSLIHSPLKITEDPTQIMEWVSLYALAVNEEHAAGGRVVTAPTNGSSGIIPAVLHYAEKFLPQFTDEMVIQFFLTTSAIAILYKEGDSLSAAEMGCQGEVGVSSSMAAAGLCAILGGTNEQIENAAEIAMEH